MRGTDQREQPGSNGSAVARLLSRWDRLDHPLRHLPRAAAILVAVLLVAAMGWSIGAATPVDQAEKDWVAATSDGSGGDLALYQRMAERVIAGEDYYPAVMEEHRARDYPVRPFVAVRPPTLAMLHGFIGVDGARYVALALLLACGFLVYLRLEHRVGMAERIAAMVMLVLGGAATFMPQSGLIHELFAGLLLSLALLLYRRERWWPSLLLAGFALAVRELSAAFVMLWLVFALADRRWREVAALSGLLVLFAIGMMLHARGIAVLLQPGDPPSPGWSAMQGYGLPVLALLRLSGLALLPLALAAPLTLLPLFGWIGLGGRFGLFATLWFIGLFTIMALFARVDNFYWAQMVLPAYAAGFAFAPRALADLAYAVIGRRKGALNQTLP